jgi:hypothetical protein
LKETIIREYDKDGKLTKEITIKEPEQVISPYVPAYPVYPIIQPWSPWNDGTIKITWDSSK